MTKYVDIDAAKEAVRKAECDADYDGRRFDAEFIENALDFIPAADVAPVVHGRWIEKTAPGRKKYFECSRCGAHENKHTAIKGCYCWRCGGKMDGGVEC